MEQDFDYHRPLRERAQDYWDARLSSVPPFSAEEYFALLLDRALRALEAGDGGVSAVLSVRYRSFEIASFGRNTVWSERNPLGHAETNAIRQLSDLISLPPGTREQSVSPWTSPFDVLHSDANIFTRKIDGQHCQSLLYTTLEPCPMCAVATITAGVNSVLAAASEEWTGALLFGRLNSLPVAWPELAESQGLQVCLGSSDPSDISSFIPPELTLMLSEVLLTNRKRLEDRVRQGGVLSALTIGRALEELVHRRD
jgi:tRNA(Arg) A34 adenosine deaminase TadA